MVRRVLFLTAMFMAPVSPFVLPINDVKNDEPISIEEISLAGHKNAALVERITKTMTNSFEDFNSAEKKKKSVEVEISISNIRKKDQDDDTDDMKDKSIPGKHNECSEGMIYLSELDICVPWNPSPFNPIVTTNIYDIPQGDSPIPYSSPVFIHQTAYHDNNQDCKDDEIYLSELDICAPASPAKPLPPKTRTSIYDIMQGDAPFKVADSSERRVPNKKPNKKPIKEDNECDDGEIYLSELDICAPYPPAAPLPPKPRSPSIYDIMQGDAPQVAPFLTESELRPRRKKAPKKHISIKCGKGQLYLSELDICVPYNNCYPYGNTC